jgi:glycosyltransferase involved in cell wall biosynthesis/uncharacterized coiled-coil protein SlyX
MKIVGMMTVYNESDIVGQTVDYLISQGTELVVIDNGSTDSSYEILIGRLGKGVLSVQRMLGNYRRDAMLETLHQAALANKADWALLSDADEFPESPYRSLTLSEAIELEARKGYNLIQFNNFEFWPTGKDCDSSEKDVRKRIRYYSWHDDFQFRCWRVYPRMTIHEAGGHVPRFPEGIDAKVSPKKFIFRHYKIRSYEHGLRKVFAERLPRYDPDLRKKGWHVHYDAFGKDESYFVIDPRKLTRYDDDGNWNLTKTFDGTFGAWNPPTASERASQLEQKASEQEQKLRFLEDEKNQLASEVAQKTNTINEQEEKLRILEGELENSRRTISEKDETLRVLESDLGSTKLAFSRETTELSTIKESLGYRLMRFCASGVDRLLPDGTRRRQLRKILSRSAR